MWIGLFMFGDANKCVYMWDVGHENQSNTKPFDFVRDVVCAILSFVMDIKQIDRNGYFIIFAFICLFAHVLN